MDKAIWLQFRMCIPGCDWNWRLSLKLLFWKFKMAAGRHLGFTKMLITSAKSELYGWHLNCIYPGITEIGKCHQKCEILKIQDDDWPPSWIYQNVNNFRMDWAIWLKFELHIPCRYRNWENFITNAKFWNSKMAAAAILNLLKCW